MYLVPRNLPIRIGYFYSYKEDIVIEVQVLMDSGVYSKSGFSNWVSVHILLLQFNLMLKYYFCSY
jgi:hypothetical protein